MGLGDQELENQGIAEMREAPGGRPHSRHLATEDRAAEVVGKVGPSLEEQGQMEARVAPEEKVEARSSYTAILSITL